MILVTGGTGFLGRHLVPLLLTAGYDLRLLTRRPDAYPWLKAFPHVQIVAGDLRDPAAVASAVIGCEAVVHAAGLFSIWRGAGDFHAVNDAGTETLLAAALTANVRRVVFVSTVAVIGTPIPGRIVDEQHPAFPADAYQRSKLAAEQHMLAYHAHGLETVILRPGAFYGPGGTYAFNRLFFTDPLRGIIMQMDGGHYIIFPAYIGDVVQGIVAALQHGRSGQIYNLCGESLSHRAAFDIVCELAYLNWLPRLNLPGAIGMQFARLLETISAITGQEPFYPVGLRSYVFNDWCVSSDKARRELGFAPLSFREGAERTLAWYRAGKPPLIPG